MPVSDDLVYLAPRPFAIKVMYMIVVCVAEVFRVVITNNPLAANSTTHFFLLAKHQR